MIICIEQQFAIKKNKKNYKKLTAMFLREKP